MVEGLKVVTKEQERKHQERVARLHKVWCLLCVLKMTHRCLAAASVLAAKAQAGCGEANAAEIRARVDLSLEQAPAAPVRRVHVAHQDKGDACGWKLPFNHQYSHAAAKSVQPSQSVPRTRHGLALCAAGIAA